MQARDRKRAGFTLIELLVVVAITSVLAAIAIPQYKARQGKAFESRVRQDLRNAALAQEAYWDLSGAYFSGPGCIGLPGLRLSQGTVCTVTRADAIAFEMRTSHPQSLKQCTWASDASPSLVCS